MSEQALADRKTRIEAFNAHFRDTHNGASPEQFGIQCCQITQIPVSAFTTFSNGEVWEQEGFLLGYKYPVSFGTQTHSLWAPVQLPTGVGIAYVDLYYFDNDPASDIGAELWAYPGIAPLPGSPHIIGSAYSSGNPGLGYQSSTVFAYTVNNDVTLGGEQLNVQIYVTGGAPNPFVAFKAVDLWWYRQISPAGSQTFNDVAPGDFAYQHIEALAASGITGGCGGNNYCPNGTLTRAQMAVFLAKALGLYWPY